MSPDTELYTNGGGGGEREGPTHRDDGSEQESLLFTAFSEPGSCQVEKRRTGLRVLVGWQKYSHFFRRNEMT